MNIERGNDEMQTTAMHRPRPSASIFTGDAGSLLSDEIDGHIDRLLVEAAHIQLAGPRHGLRHRVGHVLMTLGRAIHGMEPEHPARPALRTR